MIYIVVVEKCHQSVKKAQQSINILQTPDIDNGLGGALNGYQALSTSIDLPYHNSDNLVY